jgi:hypothetical protein
MIMARIFLQYYYGYDYENSDLTLQDFRTRAKLFDQSRHALEFFANNNIPFWDMSNANSLLSSLYPNRCLAQSNGDVILIQMVVNGETITLTGDPGDTYSVEWFDPFVGGNLIETDPIGIGDNISVGKSPYNSERGDWIVLLRRKV